MTNADVSENPGIPNAARFSSLSLAEFNELELEKTLSEGEGQTLARRWP